MSWLRRGGRHAAVLSAAERELLAEMLADATDMCLMGVGQPCAACERSGTLLCGQHAAEVRQVDAYRELAARLGVDTG
jgi:hypothetical protein